MRVKTLWLGILAVALVASGASAQTVSGKLLPSSAINMPSGADIVTDVSLSDNDLLIVIKQAIPLIGEVAKIGVTQGFGAATKAAGTGVGPATVAAAIEKLDTTKLSEAIDKVKSVRVVVAKYQLNTKKKDMLRFFDDGVTKTGKFSRIVSDVGFGKGVLAVYAESENGGYVAYMHDPAAKMIYAGRLEGFLDLPKIIAWGVEAGKAFMPAVPAVEENKEAVPTTDVAPVEEVPATGEQPKTE